MGKTIVGTLRVQRGLRSPTYDPKRVQAPRFPTASLTDAELRYELRTAQPGEWREAVEQELRRRSE